MRILYRSMIRLHPPRFRRRFEEEMMLIYDEAAASKGSVGLTFDAFCSLLRQWILRSDHWQSNAPLKTVVPGAGAIPQFASLETSGYRAGCLVIGGVLTLTFFAAIPFLATHGVQSRPRVHRANQNTGTIGTLSAFVDVDLHASTDSSGVPAFTPAERRLLDWLQIYNSGDFRTMNAFYRFHKRSSDSEALATEETEQKVREWSATFQRSGPLRLSYVVQYGNTVSAVAGDSNKAPWSILLSVEPRYPNHIAMLQMGDHILLRNEVQK